LRIGEYRVEPALDQISCNGAVSKLEPRGMSLLICLARHAGQVVSVDQLLDEVWTGVVVNPDSVYQTVATLRKILKDDPKDPRYIANVVRRGYRLVAPVAPWQEPETSPAEPPESSPNAVLAPALPPVVTAPAAGTTIESAPSRHARRFRLLAVGAGLAMLAAIALIYMYAGRPPPAAAPVAGETPKAQLPSETAATSVAVLPFLDLSEHHDEGYFADGISEELIDLLARDSRLRVPARTSSFYFKGRDAPIAEIARALNVGHVLEGSVRKSGDTLRITTQLIRADTGFHVWSQTFDRPVADVLRLQDEIAAAVVSSMKLSILAPRNSPAPAVNSAAYTLYLKGKNVAQGGGAQDFQDGLRYVQQALVLDPKFAPAWSALADLESMDIDWHGSGDIAGACTKARKPLAEALRLNPMLADAHRIMARLHGYCDIDPDAAEAELKRAAQLDPSSSVIIGATANFLTSINRASEALPLALKAVTMDPLNVWAHIEVGFALGSLGRLREAEAAYRKALEVNPSYAGLHALIANSLLAQGRVEEAVAENAREADEEFRMMNQPQLLESQHRPAEALRALEDYLAKYPDPYTAAIFYACRNDPDRAISYLRQMPPGYNLWDVPNRMNCFAHIAHDPRFQAIWAAQKRLPKVF